MELDKLAAALVAFQSGVPTIAKNRTATIPTKSGNSYSYKYADLTDIWDAIRKPLKDNGLAVTQSLVGGSNGWTGIKTTVWHESGQSFSETVELSTEGRTPQEIGSAVTYFKRYALAAALGISTEEDDDGKAASAKPADTRRQRPAAGKLRDGTPVGEPETKKPRGTMQGDAGPQKDLYDAKEKLRAGIKHAGADPAQYFWVKDATVEDIPRILGLAEALNSGKVVSIKT